MDNNRILDYLYPALANEIQQQKTLMQGWNSCTNHKFKVYIRGYNFKTPTKNTQTTTQTKHIRPQI